MCRGLKEGGDSWGIAVEWNSGDLVRVWRRELGEVKEKMGVGGVRRGGGAGSGMAAGSRNSELKMM